MNTPLAVSFRDTHPIATISGRRGFFIIALACAIAR